MSDDEDYGSDHGEDVEEVEEGEEELSDASDDEELEAPRDYHTEITVIKPDNCITSYRISDYERVAIIGMRAEQIAKFNNCLVDIGDLTDPTKMAELELKMRKFPINIHRKITKIDRIGRLIEFVEIINPNDAHISN
jgi:DNA-directed RNA polymerase subunit K/omega